MENTDNERNERHFAPLLISIAALGLTGAKRDQVIGNYRFMYVTEQGFAYKHLWTREYVYITEAGICCSGQINLMDIPLPAESMQNKLRSDISERRTGE
ncbi:hypothetical protein AB4Z50_14180 [Paenibacillus sp. 2TAB26]|uniref:hypothetical protein n=1 Tax=Paenibacillus sp. 2TAB26 TaxID=3233005 RepID=UPI003F9E57E5